MQFDLVYDVPGRLRVRGRPGAFTPEKGYRIAEKLIQEKGISAVKTNHVTGSILVLYCKRKRNFVLELLMALELEDLQGLSVYQYDPQLIEEEFKQELFRSLFFRFVIRPLIPTPLRRVVLLARSMKYLLKGLASLLSFKIDVPVLDATAIGVALATGNYKTASSIMFMLSMTEALEEYTRKKSRSELSTSLILNVDKVWLVQEGKEVFVPTVEIKINDVVNIRAGSVIPFDGTIVDGVAMVNQATMTGESQAVLRDKDATVFAGTVVEAGSIAIEVNALTNDSRISQIIELIENSESLKSEIQNQAEKLADSIVPYSFLGFLAVYGLTGNFTKALSVIMVDFSCAIKLAMPIAVISAMREAASRGMMVKGGKFLEAYARADTIVFDKTGTLTVANPRVTRVIAFDDYSEDAILRTAACLEEHFPHSVARSIVEKAHQEKLKHEEEHAEVEYIVAHGIASQINGQKALIGSYHFIFEDEKIPYSDEKKIIVQRACGSSSVIYLAIGGELAGAIAIEDPIRDEASDVITQLRQAGIEGIYMLTGDAEMAAKNVALQLGLDDYRAQVLPENKADLVAGYKRNGHQVIMVGDGINDTPALATADVSIAMKEGSDIAREVADIIFIHEGLDGLVDLKKLSKALMNRVSRSYWFIVLFNSSLIGLGLTGAIMPTTSAWLHNLSTMGVSLNNMRPLLTTK